MLIRPPTDDELTRLQEIEDLAGVRFIEAGYPEVAGDPPPTLDELRGAAALLVAVVGGELGGYVWVDIVDGQTHVEQISVLPTLVGRGVGAALLDAVAETAIARGDAAITLTTFRDVSFNAPLYQRRGFEILPDDERGPELVALMHHEATLGLDPDKRVAMRRRLDAP